MTAQTLSLDNGGQGDVTGTGGGLSNLRTAAVRGDRNLLPVDVGVPRAHSNYGIRVIFCFFL